MLTAIVRNVGLDLDKCELTYMGRDSINVSQAIQQHTHYQRKLEEHGVNVVPLIPLDGHPDAVFVEDTAIVFPELAIITNLGTKSRQGEEETITTTLEDLGKRVVHIQPPATLEGGDVMVVGKKVYVGISTRTNDQAIMQLSNILKPYDFKVIPVEVKGCLHLKTGCTSIGDNTLLANRSWVDTADLGGYRIIDVDASEPSAANSLLIGDTLLYSATFPRTQAILERTGINIDTIAISELEKAEAGLTCMSLIFEA